jgi:hypothetical protein
MGRICRRMHPVDKRPFREILNGGSKKALLIDSAQIRMASCLESEPIESLRSALFEDPDKVTVNLPMFNEKFARESCVNNALVCMV